MTDFNVEIHYRNDCRTTQFQSYCATCGNTSNINQLKHNKHEQRTQKRSYICNNYGFIILYRTLFNQRTMKASAYKINQTVYHNDYGKGKIIDILNYNESLHKESFTNVYPIKVKFENGIVNFTLEGYEYEGDENKVDKCKLHKRRKPVIV